MSYILGVDVWQGNLNIDEPTLRAGGVKFMIVRLNSISGGHHKDANFDAQWEQAASFIHYPYFVFNPWVNGAENFSWLALNAPEGIETVAIDIEVRKTGYSPAEYALQVREFMRLAQAQWRNVHIYSGAWFLSYLSEWPKTCEYWWARYPYIVYPPQTEHITWAQLTEKVNALHWTPGTPPVVPCRLWQVTADRYILPGCDGRSIDINLWNGTEEELAAWVGGRTPPPPQEDWAHALTGWARGLGYSGPDPV